MDKRLKVLEQNLERNEIAFLKIIEENINDNYAADKQFERDKKVEKLMEEYMAILEMMFEENESKW